VNPREQPTRMLQNYVFIIRIHCYTFKNATNSRAWDLLTQILDEKPYVQSELPYEIANWVTVESRREEADGTLPSSIDQIEAELEEMKKRFVTATEGKSVESGDTEMWMHGWKRYQGDWIPRPIGIL